jgi:hypothetical protein
LIRQNGGEDAAQYVERLHALATEPHKDTRARIAAIQILLERGYGKPPQDLNITAAIAAVSQEAIARLSDEELAQAISIGRKLKGGDGIGRRILGRFLTLLGNENASFRPPSPVGPLHDDRASAAR